MDMCPFKFCSDTVGIEYYKNEYRYYDKYELRLSPNRFCGNHNIVLSIICIIWKIIDM